ncbi:MAG: hypothetical protein WB773_19130 [Isosphaeraceae bacterium]
MKLVLKVGFIMAVIMIGEMAILVPAPGPGKCRFTGPDSGTCQCQLFVRSGGYDGMCMTCSHPRWIHAGD